MISQLTQNSFVKMGTELLPFSGVNVALCLGLIALIIAYFKTKSRSSKKLAPGPRGLGALRGILEIVKENNLLKKANEWYGKYGELVLCRSVLGNLCFLNSARLTRKLYASKELEQFTNDRPKSFTSWYVLFDCRDVNTSSTRMREEWPKMRKLFHQVLKFYGSGVDRMESTVQEQLRRLVTELEKTQGKDTDIHAVISHSVICITLILVTGECPNASLIKSASAFDRNVNLLYDPVADMALTACPWLRFLPFLPYRKLCQDVIQARDELLLTAFQETKATHVSGKSRGIVDTLLDEQKKEVNQWLTDDHIRALILDVVGAAFLTTTQTVKSLFLYLTHYPEVQRKIQEEIDCQLGQKTPMLQDRSNLPYTEAAILETLRMSSPVYMSLPHFMMKDVTVDEYTIPQGTRVLVNTLLFQNDAKVFGDPDVFRPERFLDDQGQLLEATHPLRQSIIPFGFGKRSCAGENFAKSRLFLFVTTILQKFDILPPEKHALLPADIESAFNFGIVLHLKPFHAIFKSRGSKASHQAS